MFNLKRKISKFVACSLAAGSLVGQKVMAKYPVIIGSSSGFNSGSNIVLTTEEDKKFAEIASNARKLHCILPNYQPCEPYATWVKIGSSGNRTFYALVFGCRNLHEDGSMSVSYSSSVSNEKAGELVRGARHGGPYGYTMFENPKAFANQGCITVPNPFIVHESENRKGEAMSVYFETKPLNWSECPFYAGPRDKFRMDGHHFIVTELSEDGETEKVVEWPEEIVKFARLKKENALQEKVPSYMKETDKRLPENGKEVNKNNDDQTSDKLTKNSVAKISLLVACASTPLILGALPGAGQGEDLTSDLD